MFGFASVAGPLLGGVIVEHLSWRWIFYVNLPIGLIALVVIATTLPATSVHRARDRLSRCWPARGRVERDRAGRKPRRHDLGVGLGADGAGGDLGVLLLGVFLAVERRAREPVLPIAGAARRGVFAFGRPALADRRLRAVRLGHVPAAVLPDRGSDTRAPRAPGLRLIPLMGGLVLTSVVSGRVISRTGHYRFFPIAGTADG